MNHIVLSKLKLVLLSMINTYKLFILTIFQETRKFQYVFLTPLGLENLKDEKEDVNVVYFKKNEG